LPFIVRSRGHREVAESMPLPAADLSHGFFGAGSLEFPFSVGATLETLRSHMGLSNLYDDESKLAGFSSYCGGLREEARRIMLVEDEGLIADDMEFVYAETCWQKHFGLCERDDRDIIGKAKKLVSKLHSAVTCGSFYRITAVRGDAHEVAATDVRFVYAAFQRGQDPKLTIFAVCEATPAAVCEATNAEILMTITISCDDGHFVFLTGAQLVKQFMSAASESAAASRVTKLSCATLVYEDIPGRILSVRRLGVKGEDVEFTATRSRKKKVAIGRTRGGCRAWSQNRCRSRDPQIHRVSEIELAISGYCGCC